MKWARSMRKDHEWFRGTAEEGWLYGTTTPGLDRDTNQALIKEQCHHK